MHLSKKRKRQLGILLALMLLASFAEVLSLGAVLPFLAILTTPDKVFSYPHAEQFLIALGIRTAHELLLPVTVFFISAALLAGGMRLLLLYVNTKLSFSIGADFSYEIYKRTLYQPYSVHVSRNSSEVISTITGKVSTIINSLLLPLLTLLSATLILITILAALLSVDPVVSLVAFAGFGTIYVGVIVTTRKSLERNSGRVSQKSTQVIQILQEGLGGIRDVLLDGSQPEYCKNYRQADTLLRDAQASSAIISGAPRYAAEALGIAFIAILAYAMAAQPGGVTTAITTLGVLALGAQRLLPILQQIYSSVVAIRGSKASLFDALALLNQSMDLDVHTKAGIGLPFKRNILLRDLAFQYAPHAPWVLRGLSLEIPKGSRIGFIGSTGSGKSTLLDIIMGLLPATCGGVVIDGIALQSKNLRAWQQRIAHVPQSIYLADSSIAENIAFGVPSHAIDAGRLHNAAKQAQIADYIDSLPGRYKTHVGERGVRLSGGQRQRIGIARALYRQAEVIVFDEATSALDNETEKAVMDAIESLGEDLTILIIAHRLSTLQRCDKVVELSNGRISRSGTYGEMVKPRGTQPLHPPFSV